MHLLNQIRSYLSDCFIKARDGTNGMVCAMNVRSWTCVSDSGQPGQNSGSHLRSHTHCVRQGWARSSPLHCSSV